MKLCIRTRGSRRDDGSTPSAGPDAAVIERGEIPRPVRADRIEQRPRHLHLTSASHGKQENAERPRAVPLVRRARGQIVLGRPDGQTQWPAVRSAGVSPLRRALDGTDPLPRPCAPRGYQSVSGAQAFAIGLIVVSCLYAAALYVQSWGLS